MLHLQWQQNVSETSEARRNGQRSGDDARYRTGWISAHLEGNKWAYLPYLSSEYAVCKRSLNAWDECAQCHLSYDMNLNLSLVIWIFLKVVTLSRALSFSAHHVFVSSMFVSYERWDLSGGRNQGADPQSGWATLHSPAGLWSFPRLPDLCVLPGTAGVCPTSVQTSTLLGGLG